MKTTVIGRVENRLRQSVSVKRVVGICSECGHEDFPLYVEIQWGGLTPVCKLSATEAIELANHILNAAQASGGPPRQEMP